MTRVRHELEAGDDHPHVAGFDHLVSASPAGSSIVGVPHAFADALGAY